MLQLLSGYDFNNLFTAEEGELEGIINKLLICKVNSVTVT